MKPFQRLVERIEVIYGEEDEAWSIVINRNGADVYYLSPDELVQESLLEIEEPDRRKVYMTWTELSDDVIGELVMERLYRVAAGEEDFESPPMGAIVNVIITLSEEDAP